MEILNCVKKDEREIILGVIDKLTEFNCVETFSKYLYTNTSKMSEFEREYNTALRRDLVDLAKEVLTSYFSQLTENRKLELLVEVHIDCPYSFESAYDNEEFDWFINNYVNSPAERLVRIKDYMVKKLNDVEFELSRTNTLKEREALKERLDYLTKQNNNINKEMLEIKSKLDKTLK